MVKKTPKQWMKTKEYKGLVIHDPDGWNRQAKDWDKEWNTPLTHDEFQKKLMFSTIQWRKL